MSEERPRSPIEIRLPYNQEHYIEREELAMAKAWLASSKRLLAVTAIPAAGKTWFLRRMEEEFSQNDIITFWIDVHDLIPDDADGPVHISSQRFGKWLDGLIAETKQNCAHVPDDLTMERDLLIERFAIAIAEECWPGRDICIFVDQGDELSEKGWREFERKVLEPFASQADLNFVIALRERQRIRALPLRVSEKRLHLDVWRETSSVEISQGEAQLNALTQNAPDVAARLTSLLATLPTYDRSYPGLNTFFYQIAKIYETLDVSTIKGEELLRAALLSLNPQLQSANKGEREERIERLITLLLGVADFEDVWASEEIADWLGVPNSTADKHVSILRDNWLVTEVGTGQFKIHDGLRQFVRGVLGIVTEVRLGPDALDETERERFLKELADSIGLKPEEIDDLASGKSVFVSSETANWLKANVVRTDVTFISEDARLRTLLNNYLSEDELEVACFDAKIPFGDVRRKSFSLTIVEVLNYCKRHGRLEKFIAACQQQNSNITWPI